MGIRKEWQWLFICDTCGTIEPAGGMMRRNEAIKEARENNDWHIGLEITCPKCTTSRKQAGQEKAGETK